MNQGLMITCKAENCCQKKKKHITLLPMVSSNPSDGISSLAVNENRLIIASKPSLTEELSNVVITSPILFRQFLNDVWRHITYEPKKPSWNFQTTVVLGFLQAFRDQTYTNSLEFWRLMSSTPALLTPITSHIEDGSFVVSPRPLECIGILRQCDIQEKGDRILQAEWMTGKSLLEHCAYCAMSAQTHRTLTHKISISTGRRIFAINYRLAPETPFPGALYDAVQSYLYLIDPQEKHYFDPKAIMIMGDSAGGGLALSMLLYLRDHGLPLPEGACLLSPWVDLSFSYPSWNTASLFDYLPNNPDQLDINPQELYLGPNFSKSMLQHPYVSPLHADNFDYLPPIMVQSGGCESLRDEIDALQIKISQSKSTFLHNEVYDDMVHVFQALPLGESPAQAIESIGWWARTGASMISKYQVKHIPPQDLVLNSLLKNSPALLGRRHRSIPC
ncbi:unnamed protein product [Cunninghamella blakesleeana]